VIVFHRDGGKAGPAAAPGGGSRQGEGGAAQPAGGGEEVGEADQHHRWG